MTRNVFVICLLAFFVAACGQAPSRDLGLRVYTTSCAPCHGVSGKGDGELAGYLFPRPRDFTRGAYKIRSGMEPAPAEEDLKRVIARGMAGSAMPAWQGRLSDNEITAVARYVKTFAPDAFSGAAPNPIAIGKTPDATPERIASGREIYKKMQCAKCHGESGVGDGPSAAALKDEIGYPIPPANFTQGIFKGGDEPRDIYTRFTTGMLGTPMPSFGDLLTDDERWSLTLYVKSMATESMIADEPQTIAGRMIARVTDDPYDPVWRNIPPARVALRPLWQRAQYSRFVEVRAAHDHKTIAVHLTWFDPAKDFSNVEVSKFRDAAAVQFPLDDKPGFFGMGAVLSPSNIWHWTADAQEDINRIKEGTTRWDQEEAYPYMVADAEPFSEPTWYALPADARVRATKNQDPTFISGWGAGNPLSEPERKSPCKEYNAKGPGSLTAQPHDHQSIAGNGVWRGGVWTLVLLHEYQSGDDMDVQFKLGAERPVSFAIWDGATGDRDGQKVVSQWHKLKLEP